MKREPRIHWITGYATKNWEQEQEFRLGFGHRGGVAPAEAPGNKIPGFGDKKDRDFPVCSIPEHGEIGKTSESSASRPHLGQDVLVLDDVLVRCKQDIEFSAPELRDKGASCRRRALEGEFQPVMSGQKGTPRRGGGGAVIHREQRSEEVWGFLLLRNNQKRDFMDLELGCSAASSG